MTLFKRLFLFLGALPMLYLAWIHLPLGKVDDWSYAPWMLSREILLALLALGLWGFPLLVESLIAWWNRKSDKWQFNLIEVTVVIMIIGIMAAISVPNFKKARMGGLATGGAKDINAFRHAVETDYLPQETDITYEGLFFDYYFNTIDQEGPLPSPADPASAVLAHAAVPAAAGATQPARLFTPVCSWARLPDPLSGEMETFLAVGLRSGVDEKAMKRRRLNLVVVLDISGSMSAGFNSYYYDQFLSEADRKRIADEQEITGSKMMIAGKALVDMMDRLAPTDRFGIVLFNDYGHLAKPMRAVGQTDMEAIKRHVLAIKPDGGTSMEAGLRLGRTLFNGLGWGNPEEVENRIIFLTDAMPNTGMITQGGLLGLAEEYARDRIYTTFIGVGVDFQTKLVENITKIRGANYLAIHSSVEFKRRLAREFDYLITPMVFNLNVTMQSTAFEIAAVYGSPEADQATGELMKVNTLFPAPLEDNAVKGGVILLKLRRKNEDSDLRLTASYEDRSGQTHRYETTTLPPPGAVEYCGSPDVRKAVLLARFVRLMKEWLIAERPPLSTIDPHGRRNQWEHTSKTLSVSAGYVERMKTFLAHFTAQQALIADPDLEREAFTLRKLVGVK